MKKDFVNYETSVFRQRFAHVLRLFRHLVYRVSGNTHFPTDKELADILGVSPVAFSCLIRATSSPGCLTLCSLVSYFLQNEDRDSCLKLIYELFAPLNEQGSLNFTPIIDD